MKILILKSDVGDFESLINKYMKQSDVDVMSPYRSVSSKFMQKIRSRMIASGKAQLISFWYSDWRKHLHEYDVVIHYDSSLSINTVKWISVHQPACKQIVWFWNIPGFDIEPFQQYAEIACYDRHFCQKHGIHFSEQFFFSDIMTEYEKQNLYDVVYVGKDKNRYDKIVALKNALQKAGLRYHFLLVRGMKQSIESDDPGIVLTHQFMTYPDLLKLESQSRAILELNPDNQDGLTLRALEALFLEKKLITDNQTIQNFDFYHPNNIYVLGEQMSLEEFFALPVVKMNDALRNHYTYQRWLEDMKKIVQ